MSRTIALTFRQLDRLEQLEDRCVPVTWPVDIGAAGPHIMGTYGQYQEVSSANPQLTGSIHLHEGLDIPKEKDSAVYAVMAGTVEAIFRDTVRNPSGSFIVIRDSQGNKGWTYRHVITIPALDVGDAVAEGQKIATVADFVGGSAHVHLERGEAPAALPNGQFRDSTIPTSDAYKAIKNELESALQLLLQRDLPAAAYGQAIVAASLDTQLLEAMRWQYKPLFNPLTEFQTLYTDVLAPTVDAVAFRLGGNDELGNQGGGGPTAELRRDTANYFNGTVVVNSIGNQPLIRLGRNTTVIAANGESGIASYFIDFVVNAYDRFAIAGKTSQTKLNPLKFDFSVTERRQGGATSGTIQSFDFTAFPNYAGIMDFFDRPNTRSAYENDQDHDSGLIGPFWYIVTNTPDANRVGPPVPGGPTPGAIFADNRDIQWNSLAPAGHAFSSQQFADDNAHAAYPDGIYDITVGVSDLQGNQTPKTVTIVLLNWTRTLEPDKGVYANNEAVKVSGEQYRANQAVDIYAIPVGVLGPYSLPNGNVLPAGNKKITVTTDADGKFSDKNLGGLGAGFYVIVADYNGDGEFTEGLDAFTVIFVGAAGNPPNVGSLGLSSSDDSSVYTQAVTFTATIEASNPSDPLPAGQIAFYSGSTLLGLVDLNSNGVASLTTSGLQVGSHSMSAHFVSDIYAGADFSASLTQTVSANETSLSLIADLSQTEPGNLVTLTASVTPLGETVPGTPSGSVKFYEGDQYLGSSELDESGTATLTISDLPRGVHEFVANYEGDSVFAGSTSDATLTVANNAPIIVDSGALTLQNTPVLITVRLDDSDLDGDMLSVSNFTQGEHGEVSLSADGFVYTPDTDFFGTDTFTYTVEDGYGGTTTATVTIIVCPAEISVSTDEDTPIIVDVLSNFPSGSFTLLTASDGENGSVIVNQDGTLTYTPDADWNGTDVFWYVLSDASDDTAYGIVTVTVNPVNDAPVANDDWVAVAPDTPTVIAVKANDTDVDGDTLTVTAVTQGTNGTVDLTGGVVTYTPNSLFAGLDSFTYTISDGNGGEDTATVTVRVDNHAPTASGDSTSVHGWSNNAPIRPSNASVSGNVLSMTSDTDGDTLTASLVSGPSHGTVTVAENGAYTYLPDQGYTGSDSFQFLADDGFGGTAVGTISINVTNNSPSAMGGSVPPVHGWSNNAPTRPSGSSVGGNVLSTSSDTTDGDPLVASVSSNPSHGTVTMAANGVWTYYPNQGYTGSDSFQFQVDDGLGGVSTATISIDVTNSFPMPSGSSGNNVHSGQSIQIPVSITDSEGDPLVVTITQPHQGLTSVTYNPATHTFTYTAPSWFTGTVTVYYSVDDGFGSPQTGSFTVDVYNNPPTAVPGSVYIFGSGATTFDLSTVASDMDGDPLSYSVDGSGLAGLASVSSPSGSVVTITPIGSPSMTSGSFTFTVYDGLGGSSTNTVYVYFM